MRNIFLIGILFCLNYSNAMARDLWLFNGSCKEAYVKQGRPDEDMNNIKGSIIRCDAASIMELDNGIKLVQFSQKHGTLMPPGFAGSEFKYTEGKYLLVVDRVYRQLALAGKTFNQISDDTAKNAMPAEGWCSFNDADFSKLTDFSCVTKTVLNASTKFVYKVPFIVTDISVKRNFLGSNEVPPTIAKMQKTGGDFEHIFEYTMFDKTLPDGKHPVWIYYQARENIMRVDMPSLDMCVITPQSSADLALINSKSYNEIPKSSEQWSLAQKIWTAAFQRYLIVGQPRAC